MDKYSIHHFDKNLQIATCTLQTRQEFSTHYHREYIIGCMVEGKRALAYGAKPYLLQGGHFFLVNPYDNHACIPQEQAPMIYYSITVPMDVIEQTVKQPLESNTILRFSSPVISDPKLLDLFLEFHYYLSHKTGSDRFKKTLFSTLINYFSKKYMHAEPLKRNQNEKILLPCAYLQEHMSQRISIDTICKTLEIKPTTFFIQFEKQLSITPKRFLMVERINAAKNLLKKGINISKVATSIGFCDHSHFTHAFKKFEGITPTEYRRTFKRIRFS